MKIETNNIPKPEGIYTLVSQNGDTKDIVSEIIKADKDFKNEDFCKFAKQFERSEKGLKNLWNFVRNEIEYKEDELGWQFIQYPPALYKKMVGDCKSKTLFINAVLRCLQIPYSIRFAGYGGNKVTHVYTVAHLDGKDIIIDSVYDSFNKEAKYTFKNDYKMTKIAVIKGIGTTEQCSLKCNYATLTKLYQSEISKELEMVRQKQSFLKEAEPISFSKLTEGEASARIFKRQLEILETFEENTTYKKQLKEALSLTKDIIKNTGTNEKVCITGVIPDYLQGIVDVLVKKLALKQPALNPKPANPNLLNAQIGNLPYTAPSGVNAKPTYFDSNGYFFLGANSEFKKKFTDLAYNSQYTMGAWFTQIINEMLAEDILNASGQAITNTTPQIILPNYMPVYRKMFGFSQTSGQFYIKSNLLTTNIVNITPNINIFWYDGATKTEFENRIKIASGIYDAYLNDIFKEQKGIGNAIIYGFSNEVVGGNNQPISLNSFPTSVAAKYTVHSQWISFCSQFSGLSVANVKGMSANTILYTSGGKQPVSMLTDLLKSYNPSIGIEPATIALIIGLIVSAISAAVGATQQAKVKGDKVDQINMPQNWQPVGAGLEFADTDWDSGTTPAGTTPNAPLYEIEPPTDIVKTLAYLGMAYGLYLLVKKP